MYGNELPCNREDAFTGSERGSGGRGAAAVTARLQVRWRELVSDPLNVFLPSSTRSAASCRFSDTRTTCHPPFGHGGEIALNYCMRDAGGFEGNGQTLRILSRLEDLSNPLQRSDQCRFETQSPPRTVLNRADRP